MKIYQYPKCSTCRKALQFLKQLDTDAEVIDISFTPPTKSEILRMLKHYNNEVRKLFNVSGLQYRDLNLKDKLPKMDLDKAIDLLSKNGMLIRRPFLISSKVGLLGFDEKEWKAKLK